MYDFVTAFKLDAVNNEVNKMMLREKEFAEVLKKLTETVVDMNHRITRLEAKHAQY